METLVDSNHDIASVQAWVLQQLGVEAGNNQLFRYIGKPLEETFDAEPLKPFHPDFMIERFPELLSLAE